MINPKSKWGRKAAIGAAVAAGLVSIAAPAFASTTATGNETLALNAGALSVSILGGGDLSGVVAGTATGELPLATMSDTTGTGAGWNTTIALSEFSYTGSWAAPATGGGTIGDLSSTSGGAYTGSHDGDIYTVSVTAASDTASWVSTYSTTVTSFTITPGTANVLHNGVSITFAKTPTATGSFVLDVGVQPNSAVALDTSAGTVVAQKGTTSANPTLQNSGVTVTAAGVSSTPNSAGAVVAVSAAVGTGMGSYTVAPGATVTTDPNSWAATYSANAEYSIVAGP